MANAVNILNDTQLQRLWAATETAVGGGEKLPPGKYVGAFEDFDIGLSRSEQNPRKQITWKLRVVDGDYADHEHWFFDGLETEQNIAYTKKTAKAILGHEAPGDLKGLVAALGAARGRKVIFDVVQNGEFLNTYVRESVAGQGTAPAAAAKKTGKKAVKKEPEPDVEENALTAEDVRAMEPEELEAAFDEYGVVKPDNYDELDWPDVAEYIIEQLGL